jgi:hypothetical protein
MKTFKEFLGFATILVTMVLLNSCIFDNSEKVSGNGKVEKQDRDVSSFSKIDASGVFNVYLSQGEKESVVIEADDNLLSLITTRVEDNTLFIEQKEHISIKSAKRKDIYITFKDLSKLKINSVGNIRTSNTLHLKELNLDHSGVGNIQLEFECHKLIAEIHSVGQVTLKGKADYADIKNSSVGNTNASELFVNTLHLQNSSVGNVEVHAEKEVYVNSSGIGNVTIRGNAEVKELSSSGIGKVSKK